MQSVLAKDSLTHSSMMCTQAPSSMMCPRVELCKFRKSSVLTGRQHFYIWCLTCQWERTLMNILCCPDETGFPVLTITINNYTSIR